MQTASQEERIVMLEQTVGTLMHSRTNSGDADQPLQTMPKSRSNDSDLSERGVLEKGMVEEWRELGETVAGMIEENKAKIRQLQEEIIAKNRILQQSILALEHQQELLQQKSKNYASIVEKLEKRRQK